eukprot:1185702-Prorocentrum_minimum.AAC.2
MIVTAPGEAIIIINTSEDEFKSRRFAALYQVVCTRQSSEYQKACGGAHEGGVNVERENVSGLQQCFVQCIGLNHPSVRICNRLDIVTTTLVTVYRRRPSVNTLEVQVHVDDSAATALFRCTTLFRWNTRLRSHTNRGSTLARGIRKYLGGELNFPMVESGVA